MSQGYNEEENKELQELISTAKGKELFERLKNELPAKKAMKNRDGY